MSVFLKDLGVAYCSVPKSASTTVKAFFSEYAEPQFTRFLRAAPDPARKVMERVGLLREQGLAPHKQYPTLYFDEFGSKLPKDAWKFTVVRDPIDRILSCYGNRVVHMRRLELPEFAAANADGKLSATPSLEEFIEHLECYCDRSNIIRIHCAPLSSFVGRDPGLFDAIYNTRQLGVLHDALSERLPGKLPPFRHLQVGGPKFRAADLSGSLKRKIETLLSEDYQIFGQYL